MNSATIGGLYDRMLFGETLPGFQSTHRDYPRKLSNEPLDPLPIGVSSDGSVTEVERAWRKKDSGLAGSWRCASASRKSTPLWMAGR